MKAINKVTKAQIEMLTDPAHIKVWACGRRWAKTLLMAMALLDCGTKYPGCMSWYVSPRYARSLSMMRKIQKVPGVELLDIDPKSQFPPRFHLPNGSEIWFISADKQPDNLRGEKLKLVCFDEASTLSKYLYESVLMPSLMDSGGTMIAGSTFNGRNWFYDLVVESQPATPAAAAIAKGTNPDQKCWIYTTPESYAFTGTPEKRANLARFKATFGPAAWQQECMCEPLAVTNAVFALVDQCVGGVPREPQPGEKFVVAQDIGKTRDPSGVVVMRLPADPQDMVTPMQVVHAEIYDKNVLHSIQAEQTKRIAEYYNNALVLLDTTGGEGGGRHDPWNREYEKVIKNFQPIIFSISRKRMMVDQLALAFETKRVQIPAQFKELISQLKLYQMKFGETAMQPTYFGRPDDLVAAMMMANYARMRAMTPSSGGGMYGMGTT